MKFDRELVFAEISQHPEFLPHLQRLRKARIIKKPFFFPFPKYTSVLFNTIFLSRTFHEIDDIHQAGVLCHEAVHLWQWDKLGPFSFMARYSQPQGRLELEKEAFRTTFHWWIVNGTIPPPWNTTNPRHYYEMIPDVSGWMNDLAYNYMLGDITSYKRLMDWAVVTVISLWNKRR